LLFYFDKIGNSGGFGIKTHTINKLATQEQENIQNSLKKVM